MKKPEQSYDVIFSTDLVTIGLQFKADKLIKIAYLDKAIETTKTSLLMEQVKNKLTDYLNPESNKKTIKIATQLDVSPFQEKVLKQLQKIPYGETRSYGEIAKILNTSARAVGNACRNNPLPIIIPCHRVVAANGIGGYDGAKSGKLLKVKRALLALEGVCL